MTHRLSPPLPLLVLAAVGCTRDPLVGYEFIGQIAGDTAVESGSTVCGVARTASMLHFLPHQTDRTCQPFDYQGSDAVVHEYMPAPAIPERGVVDDPVGLAGRVDRIRGWGRWLAGSDPSGALVVFQTDGARGVVAGWQLRFTAPLLDLEVDDQGWAWTHTGGALYGVRMDDVANGPHAVVPVDGLVDDLAVHGERLVTVMRARPGAFGSAVVVYDLSDRANPTETGAAVLEGTFLDSVGVQDDTAWVSGDHLLYAVDLRDAPAFVDEDGIDTGFENAPITLVHGDHLYIAPGFDQPLGVFDIRKPRRPRERGIGFIGGNGVFDVAVAGSVIYLAVGSGGVHVWGPKRDYEAALDAAVDEGGSP